jgi:hypothetical protein
MLAMLEQKWRNQAFFDLANLVLGAVLFFSPWMFGFEAGAATQNALVCGIAIAILALAAIVAFAEWEEWLNLVLGLWVLVSPWVLGFSMQTTPRWVHVWIGLMVVVLAGLEIWFLHRSPPRVAA